MKKLGWILSGFFWLRGDVYWKRSSDTQRRCHKSVWVWYLLAFFKSCYCTVGIAKHTTSSSLHHRSPSSKIALLRGSFTVKSSKWNPSPPLSASEGEPSQLLTDTFKYCRHEDPQLSGQGSALVGNFIEAVYRSSFHAADYRGWLRTVWDWEGAFQEPPGLDEWVQMFEWCFLGFEEDSWGLVQLTRIRLRIIKSLK